MRVEKAAGVEVRFAPDETGTISGYAAVWGRRDLYGDVVQRGAFAKSLEAHRAAGTRPLMLWAHDVSKPVGVWGEIREDATGLHVEGRLVMDSTAGRDAHAMLKAQAIDGLSIGFRTIRAEPARGGRIVHEMELIEVSLVARPAQSAARVASVRSAPHHPAAAGLAAFIRQCAGQLRNK
ncbi:Phage Prohead Protease [Roseomonas mucosa]|uniref:Phage Prohead Protease n=2 Tax=Roseomonas mucosa TaxID=207340 RepID=A0A4Y1N166_9PROT|nr:HK97 family phage prohead protease [Roseomonas mucosa]AWV23927.1 Phage Prohead Protease [Roseomonas mucosa]MDT8356411.1 HK97 family phage prohead protease [Roseomonas mucosa]QDJ10872.1 Phage Prohead Protease [Roseomonas mucosa]